MGTAETPVSAHTQWTCEQDQPLQFRLATISRLREDVKAGFRDVCSQVLMGRDFLSEQFPVTSGRAEEPSPSDAGG